MTRRDNAPAALPARALEHAQRLSCAVRDYDPDEVAAILTRLDRRDLFSLAVTLAAMVPVEQSPTELLAWNDSTPQLHVVHGPRELAPHGTHAAFNRHRDNGTEPCPACWLGERDYQRGRSRRRRGPQQAASGS